MTEQKKILFTGGSGLLGSEFRRLFPGGLYPARYCFDVCDPHQMEKYFTTKDIGTVVHAAAFTSPPKVDEAPIRAIETNIIGTCNVVKLCAEHKARLIYISTDYVFRGDRGNYQEDDSLYPVNKYGWSKLGGECAVRLYDNSVIIRTSFGSDQFLYAKAFVDQWTSREAVSVIAKMILKILNTNLCGVIHVGGKRKTVYQYAQKLSPRGKVGKLRRSEVPFVVPRDTSLNTNLYKKICGFWGTK